MPMFDIFLPNTVVVLTDGNASIAYGPFHAPEAHTFLDGVADAIDAGIRPAATRARIVALEVVA